MSKKDIIPLINLYLDTLATGPHLQILQDLDRESYLDLMASCDLMIGNSSSGIIESASLGIPCVNVGSRQNDRLKNTNTFSTPGETEEEIGATIASAMNWSGGSENVYGDGKTDLYLLHYLDGIKLSNSLLSKRMLF